MLTSYLANPEVQAYFLVFLESKGADPITQQWALNELAKSLDPFVTRLTLLLLKQCEPQNKTEEYIYNIQIEEIDAEDLYQDIYCTFIEVLRKQKLNDTDRIYDYVYLLFRQLFGNKSSLLSLQDN